MGLKESFWELFKQVSKKSYLHSYHIALSGVFLIGYSLVVLLLYSIFLLYTSITLSDVVAALLEILFASPYITIGVIIFAGASYYVDIIDYVRENDLHFNSPVIDFIAGLLVLLIAIREGSVVAELTQEISIEYETVVYLIPTYSTLSAVVFTAVLVGFVVFAMGAIVNGVSRMILSLFRMKAVLLDLVDWFTALPQRIPHYDRVLHIIALVKEEGGGSWRQFPKGIIQVFQYGLQDLEPDDEEEDDTGSVEEGKTRPKSVDEKQAETINVE